MNKLSFTIAVMSSFGALAEAKRGAPTLTKTAPVVLQSTVPEPGACCWTMDQLNARNQDRPELCHIQWTNYIDYCFQEGVEIPERCVEVFSSIGAGDFESVTPEDSVCLNVDFECYEEDAFDYDSADQKCNDQWRDFDAWCWDEDNKQNPAVVRRCEAVNEGY